MRGRLIAGTAALVLLLGGGILLAARDRDGEATADAGAGLGPRTVTAGEVEVTIEPRRLDDREAAFDVSLDTHAVELDMDLTDATLEVGGTPWPAAGWDGDGPGGHHREGKLRFDPEGPATGRVQLVLAGFPEPVDVAWDLES